MILATASNLDIALVAPFGSPGILDQKVGCLRVQIGPIANGQDTMVDGGPRSATVVGNDPLLVKLKDKLIGLNGNANGLHGNGRQQGLFVTRRHVNKGLDQRTRHVRAIAVRIHRETRERDYNYSETQFEIIRSDRYTSLSYSRQTLFASSGLVGIVGFRTESARLFIKLEGIVHETAIATQILMIAIQQILFTESDQFSRLNKLGPLQGARRRKGPTGTAGALILDIRHGPHLRPMNIVGQGQGCQGFPQVPRRCLRRGCRGRILGMGAQFEMLVKFVQGQVRIGIVTQPNRRSRLRIVRFNLGCVCVSNNNKQSRECV